MVKTMDYTSAKKAVLDGTFIFDYALVYTPSSISLYKTGEYTMDTLDSCAEARLFSGDVEMHLFPADDMAILVNDDEQQDDSIITKYSLSRKYIRGENNVLLVKQYLKPDSDGQMRVYLTRLAGLEKR